MAIGKLVLEVFHNFGIPLLSQVKIRERLLYERLFPKI